MKTVHTSAIHCPHYIGMGSYTGIESYTGRETTLAWETTQGFLGKGQYKDEEDRVLCWRTRGTY